MTFWKPAGSLIVRFLITARVRENGPKNLDNGNFFLSSTHNWRRDGQTARRAASEGDGAGRQRPKTIAAERRPRDTAWYGTPDARQRDRAASRPYSRAIFSCQPSSLDSAAVSTSSLLAKWNRTKRFSGAWKKHEPGTAPTPTLAARSTANSSSLA